MDEISKVIRWDSIPTPPLNYQRGNMLENVDTSNLQRFVTTYASAIDERNYYYMSQTEVTEFLYRASVYGVSFVTNLFN